MRGRLLYITYFFPPLGGPASIRNTKTVKYLTQTGWQIDVITIKDSEYLVTDANLLLECPQAVIYRTNSGHMASLLKRLGQVGAVDSRKVYLNTSEKIKRFIRSIYPIDDKVGWIPFFLHQGKKLARQFSYDAIYVSCGPFSSAIGAYLLSKKFSIPLIVEYRDYWTLLSDYPMYATALHKQVSRFWEKRILRHASLIVTATEGIKRDLLTNLNNQLAEKSLTVFNGWDEHDFNMMPAYQPDVNNISMAYFGSIVGKRSFRHFFAAVKSLKEQKLIPAVCKIKLYGNFYTETYRDIEQSGIKEDIEIISNLSHRQALEAMASSDILLLLINSSSPYGTLTSKLFEYIRVRRPILAMVPEGGEAAQILRTCGQNYICAMESTASIELALKEIIAAYVDFSQPLNIPYAYERSFQIAKLDSALQRTLKI